MRRWVVLALIALLLTLGGTAATAQSAEDLNALARYYDADTLVYAGIRIDDDFIEELGGLVQHVQPFLPSGVGPVSLMDELDRAIQAEGGTSFADDIRPWLGDNAALGVTLNPQDFDDATFFVSVSVDGAAALTYLEPVFADQGHAQRQSGDFTIFRENGTSDEETFVAIGPDILFISNNQDILPLDGPVAAPLAEDPTFIETMRRLPESAYDAALYFNMAHLMDMSMAQATLFMPGGLPPFYDALADASEGLAMGVGLLEERTLVVDMAQSANLDALGDFPLMPYEADAVDLRFANRVPADAVLVMQSADFGPMMAAGYAQLRALGDWVDANGGLVALLDPTGTEFDAETSAVVNALDPAMLLGVVNLGAAGTTGLSLEREVFPVLDGDMIFYIRARTDEDFALSPVLPDIGLLFQTSDNDGALHIVDSLAEAAAAYDLDFPQEDYGTGRALVAPLMEEALGMSYPGLDVLAAASDGVLAIGTRPAVEAALNTSGGLADDAAFQTASSYFLDGSQQVWYISIRPLLDIAPGVLETTGVPADETVRTAYRLASLMESASVSSVATSEGAATVRFALTLAEAPHDFPGTE